MTSRLQAFEEEFGPEPSRAVRQALRNNPEIHRLLSWLYTQDFRTPEALFRNGPSCSASEAALQRDGENNGAKRVLDFLSEVVGEDITLPPPPFRNIKHQDPRR